eukprot:scaffold2816_cov121-Cylindrotheca_fusiformis.AAC.53
MMPGSLKSLLVFLLIKISSAKWYSRVCETGEIETVMRDQDGNLLFVHASNATASNGVDLELFPGSNGTDRRQLRSSLSSTAAIFVPERRVMQEINSSQFFYVRSCVCGGAELFLCPAETDFCGVPFSEDDPIACYSVSAKEVVARNAWPLILLWYFGLVIVCSCTVHGKMSKAYCCSCFTSRYNEELMNRFLSGDTQPPPSGSLWSRWRSQRYRFEQNLLAQAQYTFRNQESQRQQDLIDQGVPAPQLEMKTMRFLRDDDVDEPRDRQMEQDDEDDNSLEQPNCSICFVPLENGDRIGALDCQHTFHSDCLKVWLSRKNACPLCSIPIAIRRLQPNDMGSGIDGPAVRMPHRRYTWQRSDIGGEQRSLSNSSIQSENR